MQPEQDSSPDCRLRVYLYGPMEVLKRSAENTWTPVAKGKWGSGKAARSVFKRLLAAPGRRLPRGKLQEDIWPSLDFDFADKLLYNAMSLIHGAIGKDLVRTWEATYELASQSLIWVDHDECASLLKAVENLRGDHIHTLPLLEQALSYLERGEYLEREEGIWCHSLRKKAEHMYRQCRMWLAEGYEAQGKIWQASEHYRALLQTMPPDEDILLCWIEMLYRHGKISEAHKCYQDIKQIIEAQGFTLSSTLEKQVINLPEGGSTVPPAFISAHSEPQLSLKLPVWGSNDAFVFMSAMSSGQLSSLKEPVDINKETLPLFAMLTEACRHLSEGNELKIAERILWTYLPRIELMARLTSERQHAAASIVSQGYLLAASLIGHRNDLLRRLQYSEQAFQYGKMAEDLNLQAVALRQIAISFDSMDRPDKVIEISQQTFPYLKNISPLLRACIYAGISGAYAELGQKQEAYRFIDQAYDEFPQTIENEPSYLHIICRYSTLIFFDALNHLDFGQPHEAGEILARIDGLQPKMQLPERVRIELLNYQIKVFIALKALEQACIYLETAAEAARAIGCERHFQESYMLFCRMQRIWRDEPQVQNLADLFVR